MKKESIKPHEYIFIKMNDERILKWDNRPGKYEASQFVTWHKSGEAEAREDLQNGEKIVSFSELKESEKKEFLILTKQ